MIEYYTGVATVAIAAILIGVGLHEQGMNVPLALGLGTAFFLWLRP